MKTEHIKHSKSAGKQMQPGFWLTVVFFSFLLFSGILAFGFSGVIGNREGETEENRTLADFPALTPENFSRIPSQLEDWLGDHAPFREQWIEAYADLNFDLFGSVDNDQVIVGKDGWLFYTGDWTLEELSGVPSFTEEQMAQILEGLLAVREKYVEDPEHFAVFLAPDKEKIYQEYLPDGYKNRTGFSQAAALVAYIRDHSDIKVVYPIEELEAAAKAEGDRPIYYKTDTHWNRLGAFVGVQELLGEFGFPKASLASLTIEDGETRAGDLAILGHLKNRYPQDDDPGFSGYYDDAVIRVLEEDLDGSGLRRTETTGAPTEARLVMVRDSFGDCMNTTLCRHFGEVVNINWQKAGTVPEEAFYGDYFVYEIVDRWLYRMPADMETLLE